MENNTLVDTQDNMDIENNEEDGTGAGNGSIDTDDVFPLLHK